eukprot:7193522-Pyramimonas_sp.AAC.1
MDKGSTTAPPTTYCTDTPVSYRLEGRMGTRGELRAAIKECRRAGVRVYADAVVNHMTGNGNDMCRLSPGVGHENGPRQLTIDFSQATSTNYHYRLPVKPFD